MFTINADSVHCIIWDKILYAKKDFKWHNALFLWLGCFRLNAALLIHFNDFILENKNMHGIPSIVRKEELFPFANLAIISLICSQFFLPERLYKQLIFFGPYLWFFYWVLLRNEQHSVNFTQLSLAVVKFTMPPICYLALTAKYMKIIFF